MDIPSYIRTADSLAAALVRADEGEKEHGFAWAYGYLRGTVIQVVAGIRADIDGAIDEMAEADRQRKQEEGCCPDRSCECEVQ